MLPYTVTNFYVNNNLEIWTGHIFVTVDTELRKSGITVYAQLVVIYLRTFSQAARCTGDQLNPIVVKLNNQLSFAP